MKLEKKYIYAVILFAVGILLSIILVIQHGMYASKVDWLSQHSVIPDYFRQRFYETKQLFPDIAWNLGGGQNIYNFSYYGLFSPVILLSYCLPFVKMDTYIMVSSLICYALSGMLFYIWLSDKDVSKDIRVLTALLFLLSAPLVYHFYVQLMFVNYMPFLILALIGCDKYFKDGTYKLLVMSVVAMILTSYYFSVGGLACIGLYVLGKSEFFGKKIILFGIIMFLSIGVCAFLLGPTAFSLFAGDRTNASAAAESNAFISFNPQKILYSPYGIGLPAISIIGLLGGAVFSKNSKRRLQAVILILILCMPIAAKLLNGGLYEKEKVFIPFLPLVCLLIAETTEKLVKNRDSSKLKKALTIIISAAVVTLLIYAGYNKYYVNYRWILMVEGILLLVGTFINLTWRRVPIVLFLSCLIMFAYDYKMNLQADEMIKKDVYASYEFQQKRDAISEILSENTGFYRTECILDNGQNLVNINRVYNINQNLSSIYSSGYNSQYMDFRNNVFNLNIPLRNRMMQAVSDNPNFLQFMGVKFVLSDKCPAGYTKLRQTAAGNIYENKNAAPICYATAEVIGEKEFNNLDFPYNQAALLWKVVVDDNIKSDSLALPDDCVTNIDFKLPEISEKGFRITAVNDGYEISADKNTTIKLPIEYDNNDVLAVSCNVENLFPNKDMHIRINGQTNRLTSESHEYANDNKCFHFVVTLKGETEVEFGKGHYIIRKLQCYREKFADLHNDNLYKAVLNLSQKSLAGDRLSGTIELDKDGYLVTSIPYDESFKILIDGKSVNTIKVNTAFLGTKLTSGRHEIIITYEAKGKKAGIIISTVCIFILLGIWLYQIKTNY